MEGPEIALKKDETVQREKWMDDLDYCLKKSTRKQAHLTLPSQPKKVRAKRSCLDKRTRLNKRQMAQLEVHYQNNSEWTHERCQELADIIGVTSTKIYKWNWDRKKKDEMNGIS